MIDAADGLRRYSKSCTSYLVGDFQVNVHAHAYKAAFLLPLHGVTF
jgi:hypothetical protein